MQFSWWENSPHCQKSYFVSITYISSWNITCQQSNPTSSTTAYSRAPDNMAMSVVLRFFPTHLTNITMPVTLSSIAKLSLWCNCKNDIFPCDMSFMWDGKFIKNLPAQMTCCQLEENTTKDTQNNSQSNISLHFYHMKDN